MNNPCRKRMRFSCRFVFALFFCLPSSTPAAFFTGLGDLPGGPFESRAFNISTDGEVVVGASAVDTYRDARDDERPLREAFRWTRETGVQSLGTLPGRPQSFASGVSSDGSVIVGRADPLRFGAADTEAFRWTEQGGIVDIGHLEPSPRCSPGSWATAVSDDGTTIVGSSFEPSVPGFGCGTQAFRFDADDGLVGLGVPNDVNPFVDGSDAVAISGDGSVIAGYSLDAFDNSVGLVWLWHEATGEYTDLGVRGFIPQPTDMTPDGSKVIGYTRQPVEPFLWAQETGAMTLSVPSRPVSISDDGSVIVGRGWIWTETLGARDLDDVLTRDFGLAEEIAGWKLGAVRELSFQPEMAVSGNGRTIAGTGTNPDGNVEAWIAILEPSLRAGDADQDYDFDQLDLVQAQINSKYLTGQPATWGEGDWNGAPGGVPGIPPTGDGLFNQLDIVAAQLAGIYLTGSYDASHAQARQENGQVSIVYNAATGELAIDLPSGTELTSINIDSAAGIFTGSEAENLGGSFDNDTDSNIFKATFGGSFGSVSFGEVAQSGLSNDLILADLRVVGSMDGGGGLGAVDLIYVPEPSTALLFGVAVFAILPASRRKSVRTEGAKC